MIRLAFYDNEKTYIYPNLQVATPDDIMMNYSAVNVAKCVIETDEEGIMFYALNTFSALKTQHKDKIDFTDLSDEDILQAIMDILNTPAPTQNNPEPTSEERIASQLELQNLLAMPDEI